MTRDAETSRSTLPQPAGEPAAAGGVGRRTKQLGQRVSSRQPGTAAPASTSGVRNSSAVTPRLAGHRHGE